MKYYSYMVKKDDKIKQSNKKKIVIENNEVDRVKKTKKKKIVVENDDVKKKVNPNLQNNRFKLNRDGYIIPKKEITREQLEYLREKLTVTPEGNEDYQRDIESFEVFEENEKMIKIPRFFGKKFVGEPIEEFNTENTKINIEFTGKLRPNQQELADVVLNKIKSDGGGILQLHTGYGKTTLSLYLAAKLGLKTLVIVHKSFLQDQWYERIKQFTNANIGMIRQKKVDVERKDIVIGMLQSISMKDYDKKVFEGFDIILVDEIHRIGSKVFSKALLKVQPKYTIGLSATPYRKDGLTKVIKWHVGNILAKVERQGDNAVYVKMFDYKSDNKLFVEKKRWIKHKIKPDTVKMTTNIPKVDERNILITSLINNLRKIDGRKILVLGGRREHLKDLQKMVDKFIQQDIKEGICEEDEVKTGLYMGQMKEYELKDSEDADIIFGTYDMAAEGLDIPGLNTLVLATPKKDIIQTVGRILRKPIQEGDVNPLVIDIVDDLSCFKAWGDQRSKYYKSQKYTIENYKAFNENIISFKEFMINEGLLEKNNNAEIDVRKEYILKKFGKETLEFEEELDFLSFPDKMFYYDTNMDQILTINHVYKNDESNNEKKTIVDLDPKIEIEI